MVDAERTTVNGVTLAEFAFVRAGLVDGLPLAELLGSLRLDAPTWEDAEGAWDDRVLDALEDSELSLLEAIDAATAEARTHWSRRIPPLDEDLRAWFDFLHAWMADEDPVAFLRRVDLGAADLGHVHRHWGGCIAQDAKLRSEALAILADDRRPPPVPAPEPPRLRKAARAARAGDSATSEVALAKGRTLPFAEGELAPMPPPLAVPLPRRRRPRVTAPGADETRLEGAAMADVMLPFVAPDNAARPPGCGEAIGVASGEPEGAPRSSPHVVISGEQIPSGEGLSPARQPAPPTFVLLSPQQPTLVLAGESNTWAPRVDPEQTMAIEAKSGAIIPLRDAVEPVSTYRPTLTLIQHAMLSAEIREGADLAEALARCGLTQEGKKAEDEYWRQALIRDAETRITWARLFVEARDQLRVTQEKP